MGRGSGARRHFRVEKLAPGVWAAIAEDGGYALCNAGIVDLGDRTVVFDSMLTPTAGAALAAEARRRTGRSANVVVNSHYHGDHTRGNVSFLPASIVSTDRTRELIESRGGLHWKWDRRAMGPALRSLDAPDSRVPLQERALYRGWFEGTLAVKLPFRLFPPDVTFDQSLTLHGSRRDLHLITYGGGHSPSDVFAYLPEERILFLGDLVTVGMHPSAGDGVPMRWADILRRMRSLEVSAAVPGHGRVGGGAEVRRIESYLRELGRTARSARRAGRSARELRQSPMPTKYRTWKFSEFYAQNLVRAFRLTPSERA
jgi:cyclase